MNRAPPVLHLTHREGLTSVYLAQVVAPMAHLKARGNEVTLIVTTPVGEFLRAVPRQRWKERMQAVRHGYGLDLVRVPSPPARAPHLWSELGGLQRIVRRQSHAPSIVLHCRGPRAAQLGLRVRDMDRRVKVVFDCRGLAGVEYAYSRGFRDIEAASDVVAGEAREIERMEADAARRADGVVCVSNAMKAAVCTRWGLSPERIVVVPCCTDTDSRARAQRGRASKRAELGLADRFVVAYCGSLEAWQRPRAGFQLFRALRKRRTDAHFMAITTAPDRMGRLLDEAEIPEGIRTLLCVPQHEVAECLAAADAGILLRDASPVNAVASPVKFAEYLAAGVPVLISPGVGDFTSIVRSSDLGIVVEESDATEVYGADAVEKLVHWDVARQAEMRARCAHYCASNLDWKVVLPRLESLYEQVHGAWVRGQLSARSRG